MSSETRFSIDSFTRITLLESKEQNIGILNITRTLVRHFSQMCSIKSVVRD